MLQLMMMIMVVVLVAVATATPIMNPPGCVGNCGGVAIPYPFGMIEGCALDNQTFLIRCESGKYPVLGDNLNITKISIEDHEITILSYVARDCYDKQRKQVSNNLPSLTVPMFTISNSRNKFTVLGCDSYAYLHGYKDGESYSMGCMSTCQSMSSIGDNGSCSGVGCCQIHIPKGLENITVEVNSFKNHSRTIDFNNCTYAFVVEENDFNFSTAYLTNFHRDQLPLVLEWTVTSNKSICGANSITRKDSSASASGQYYCKCKTGFHGNPYLSDGCRDINECEDGTHNCSEIRFCSNEKGNYSCSCPSGFIGDGRKYGQGCRAKSMPLIHKILLGIALGLVIFLSSSCMHLVRKQRRLKKHKEKLFLHNGGLILQEKLSDHEQQDGTRGMIKIFTEEELRKAAHDFDESSIIGQGGFGTVHRGILKDGKIVAIKRSKIVDKLQIEQFINEVVVLSRIEHINVVKLFGCCLETQVPLLVYEYISNGTLSDHIHDKEKASKLSLEIRLRIAAETAGVLSHLHSAAPIPIIHRDVKPTNVLLLDDYTAKVSDFGTSRLVPMGHAGVATRVQGTFGYLDPEYLHTNQLTEKSDVYSFGVVLVELLTGQKAVSFNRPEEERSLVEYFLSSFEGKKWFGLLDSHIANEGYRKQLKKVAKLAKRCLNVKREDRPTMTEVAMELQGIRETLKHPYLVNSELNLVEGSM